MTDLLNETGLENDTAFLREEMTRQSERRSSVVVSTSSLHDRGLSSRPGPDMGMFGIKTWLSTLETMYLL